MQIKVRRSQLRDNVDDKQFVADDLVLSYLEGI